MKPDGPVLRARDWAVRQIDHCDARAFIADEHYAKGAGNTSVYRFGLFERARPEALRGTSIWLPPPRPAARHVALKLDIPEDSILMLTRLACDPEVPANGAGFLLGRSIRVIRKDPRWCGLVTYADQRMGHTGKVYVATGWWPSGQTRPEALWLDPSTGQLVSRRTGLAHERRNRRKAEMLELGYVQTEPCRKWRFVMRLRVYDWMLPVALEGFA